MNKQTFLNMSYGLYIASSQWENSFSGCVVNTVTQITAEEKPKFMVAINKENYTSELALKSKKINVSVLSQEADMIFIGKFGFHTGKNFNKLEGTEYKIGENGMPIVTEKSIGYLECNVLEIIDCSTHYMFLMEAQEAEILNFLPPMTYEYYHKVIKGKTPPKASSYIG